MAKKVAILLLVALISVSFVFASGAEETKKDDVIELRVLNYIDNAEPNSANEITMVWDEFAKQHPEIKIIREDLFNEPFHQKAESYVASGNVPDVIYMWPSGRSTSLQTSGSVRDLTPLLERDGILDDYSEAALAPQAAGYLAELPNGTTSSHMMFINKKLIEDNGLKVPETLEELEAMVPVLAAKGIATIGMDNMDDWVMQSCLFSLIVGRYGGPDWYNDLAEGKIKFTDDWFVKSLEVVDELYTTGALNRNTLNSPYGNARGEFAANKSAFLIDGDWACGSLQEDVTTGKALIDRDRQANDIEVGVFPALPGEVVHNTTSGVAGTGWGISSDIEGDKLEAAWTLVKFLEGEYCQTYRLKTGASFPSLKSIDIDQIIIDENLEPLVGKRAAFYGEYGTTPVIDGVLQPDVYNIINVGLQEIGLGKKTPSQVAGEVEKAWEAWAKDNL